MIIKYYTNEFPETLYILEDVSDIEAPTSLVTEHTPSEIHEAPVVVHQYDRNYDEKSFAKIVFFKKDGALHQLNVFGTAYICNNDGKTIEKVSPK